MKTAHLLIAAGTVLNSGALEAPPARKRVLGNPTWRVAEDIEFGRNADALEEIMRAEEEISRFLIGNSMSMSITMRSSGAGSAGDKLIAGPRTAVDGSIGGAISGVSDGAANSGVIDDAGSNDGAKDGAGFAAQAGKATGNEEHSDKERSNEMDALADAASSSSTLGAAISVILISCALVVGSAMPSVLF